MLVKSGPGTLDIRKSGAVFLTAIDAITVNAGTLTSNPASRLQLNVSRTSGDAITMFADTTLGIGLALSSTAAQSVHHNAASGTAFITAPITLVGNNAKTFNIDNGSAAVDLQISGNIGAFTGTGVLTKTGAGTLTLSGANTFTGGSTIKAGTVAIGVSNVGAITSGALGTGTVLLGDTTAALNASLLTAGPFTFGNPITIQSGNTGVMTIGGNTAAASSFTGAINLGTASGTQKNVALVALAGGSVDFTGVIDESTSVPSSNVTIGDSTHSGTVKLSNVANAYGGITTIGSGATLEATKVTASGGNSSIGNSALAATNLVIDNGTLQYTGAGDSTNRLFTIGTGGATIDASAAANAAL